MNKIYKADSLLNIPGVSRETLEKLQIYADLLVKWQKSINLVSNSTLEDMWRRHFLDSVQLYPLFEPINSSKSLRDRKILDIGSGAGFPGLVLSILGLGQCHMVESNAKKCAFMNQVIRAVECDAVVHGERVEEMSPFPVNYITSRACASLDKLFDLGQNFLGEDTRCIFLKGQLADEEIRAAKVNWSFGVEKFTSQTDPSGMVLRISQVRRLSV